MSLPLRSSPVAVAVVVLSLTMVGCSGGEKVAPGIPADSLTSTVTGFDLSRTGSGVVGVQFDVTGPTGAVFNILPNYNVNGSGALSATPVSVTRAGQVGIPGGLPNIFGTTNLSLPLTEGGAPSTEGTRESFVFWWEAGLDLNFLNGDISFLIGIDGSATPGNLPTMANGSTAMGLSVPLPVLGSNGAGAGAVAGNPTGGTDEGRAGHGANAVSGGVAQDLVVTGGFVGNTAPNIYDSADRISFNQVSGTHMITNSGMGTMVGPRALHESTSFLAGNSSLRVLISGGIDFLDAAGVSISDRVSGAGITGTGVVFDPTTNTVGSTATMQVARYAHTATWTPYDQIAVIGGGTNTNPVTATAAIEHYDQVAGMFFTPAGASLNAARLGHRSVLLADGRIFVCGGEDPGAAGPLSCEIYDPSTATATVVTATGSMMSRVHHTANRLFNGWVLILGGQNPTTGDLVGTATVFKPESNSFSSMPMLQARALHRATILGSGRVLVSGGLAGTRNAALPSEFGASNSLESVFLDPGAPGGFTATTGNGLSTQRAEHSATATASGRVFVLGGRNLDAMDQMRFLSSVEVLPFSNTVPEIVAFTPTLFTSSGMGTATQVALNVSISDADSDGGYLVIRWRQIGANTFSPATIVSQVPSTVMDPGTGAMTFPNLQVGTGVYSFLWDFAADGAPNATNVEVEILPVGAVLGTPARFTVALP